MQAFNYFDLRVTPQTGLHRYAHGFAVNHPVNERGLRVRNDGLFRNHGHPGALFEDQAQANEHSRPQSAVGIGQVRTAGYGPATGIKLRIDGVKHGSEFLPRQGVGRGFNRLPRPDLAEIRLGQAKIELQAADILKVDQILSLFDIVTYTYRPDAYDPGKWRSEPGLVESGLSQGECRLLHVQCGLDVVERLLTDKFLLEELLRSLQIGLGQTEICPRLFVLGLLRC